MQLSIVIVSWNTKKLTLNCLKSIFKYVQNIKYNVFLIDNHSADCTVNEVEKFKRDKHLSNLQIIKNNQNLGFAKANNLALRFILDHSTDKEHYVLLLNADTEFLPSSPERSEGSRGIKGMINFMQSNPTVGIIGPKLLNSDQTLQKSCRRFPRLLDQFLIQLKFYNFCPEKFKSIREYFMLDFSHDEIRQVDQVMGAAMLIKKSVFEKIGLLDEKFWAIFEEVDFCKRAKAAGFKTLFFPDTKIIHHKGESFKQMSSLKKQINFNHSLYHYFKKHKPFWQLLILWLIQPINLCLTLIDARIGIKNRVGKKKDL